MSAEVKLLFTGDIGFDHYMACRWEDEDLVAPELLARFGAADHVIANVEGPLSRADKMDVPEEVRDLLHTIDPAAVALLKKIRADIWSLANNHIMDAGPEGLAATLEEAERAGAKTIGAGMNIEEAAAPVILPEAGGIGLFAVGYQRGCKPAGEEKAGCLSWSEMDLIRETISEIKKSCRWCVVVSHGGEEFTALPSPYTRDRYLAYLEMGADVVVCHHPHVPMNYELIGDKAIFYSLGNFIFDTDYQRAQYHTDEGVLLELAFTEEGFSFEGIGLRIDRETERILPAELPQIFTDVPEEEYEKLKALAAKMFLSATKRQQHFLFPNEVEGFTDADWEEHFLAEKRRGRVPGEALDFQIIYPLAQEADNGLWQQSSLEAVKTYILNQI